MAHLLHAPGLAVALKRLQMLLANFISCQCQQARERLTREAWQRI